MLSACLRSSSDVQTSQQKSGFDGFQHCFASGVNRVPEEVQVLLVRCLRGKAIAVDESDISSEEGVLVAIQDSIAEQFSSPPAI